MIYDYIGSYENVEWKIKYPLNFVHKIIQLVGLRETLQLIFTLESQITPDKTNESLFDIYLQEIIQKNIIAQEEIKKIYIVEIKNNGIASNTFNTYSPGSRFESILKSNYMNSLQENKLNGNSNYTQLASKKSKVLSYKTTPERKSIDINNFMTNSNIANFNNISGPATRMNNSTNKENFTTFANVAPNNIQSNRNMSKSKNKKSLLNNLTQQENLDTIKYQFSNDDSKNSNYIEEIMDSDKLSELDITSYSVENGFFKTSCEDLGILSGNMSSSKLTLGLTNKHDQSQIMNSGSVRRNRSLFFDNTIDFEKRTLSIIYNNQINRSHEKENSIKYSLLKSKENTDGFNGNNYNLESLENIFDEVKNWKDSKINMDII